ncbi:MAG: LuxR C-terminal-related transcriptional regulator [Eudoraea sp.]|uniref:response regulator transcription factor n=1 Tax=Eudoraea sp. TaxID=1979955 RepID=UPI003298FB62
MLSWISIWTSKWRIVTLVLTKILHYVAEGMRNREIAERLFNSEETIKKHIYHMFQKLEVKNRISLVAKVKEKGFVV